MAELSTLGAVIKAAYEGEADTNAFTDAEKTKLGHISVTQAVDLDANKINIAAPIHTLHVETVANGDYVLTFDAPYAGTITTLRTKTESGTCTVTGAINGTPLGGTANSAADTAEEQAHASDNAYAKGDEIKITVSDNSDALDLEVTFYGTRMDL